MAYVTGTASSMSDLLAALQTACTDNGWTLSGEVLWKDGCFVRLQVASGYVTLLGGTGKDGSNILTGTATNVARLGSLWAADTVAFPVSYEVFINTAPDEIYLVVNYSVDRYQWLAFGLSPVAGLTGTGGWYGGTCGAALASISYPVSLAPTGVLGYTNGGCPALFWNQSTVTGIASFSSYIHHGLDGGGWSGIGANNANAISSAQPMVPRQPNAFNGETVLIPIQPAITRASGKVSMVGDLAHSRYIRNDNVAPGEVMTLGTDRWKAYPWYQKNIANRDGVYNATHSGTLGWAIRYDGP